MTYHITALTRKGIRVDLFYLTLKQAMDENPSLCEFRVVGKSS